MEKRALEDNCKLNTHRHIFHTFHGVAYTRFFYLLQLKIANDSLQTAASEYGDVIAELESKVTKFFNISCVYMRVLTWIRIPRGCESHQSGFRSR